MDLAGGGECMMGVAYVIGAILGMDLIDTKIGADKVTYVEYSEGSMKSVVIDRSEVVILNATDWVGEWI